MPCDASVPGCRAHAKKRKPTPAPLPFLKYGQAILHRTPSKFVSFAWGSKRMALALPREGNWVAWPHYASYLGLIDGKDGSRRSKTTLTGLQYTIEPTRFSVMGTLHRLKDKVTQDFAIVSLEKDVAVYIERLRAKPGFQPKSRETGVIGHEYPLESNRRTLYGQFGQREVVGVGNEKRVHLLESDWLNLGGKVVTSFVVATVTKTSYVITTRRRPSGACRSCRNGSV